MLNITPCTCTFVSHISLSLVLCHKRKDKEKAAAAEQVTTIFFFFSSNSLLWTYTECDENSFIFYLLYHQSKFSFFLDLSTQCAMHHLIVLLFTQLKADQFYTIQWLWIFVVDSVFFSLFLFTCLWLLKKTRMACVFEVTNQSKSKLNCFITHKNKKKE